jgi:hypothetical protein
LLEKVAAVIDEVAGGGGDGLEDLKVGGGRWRRWRWSGWRLRPEMGWWRRPEKMKMRKLGEEGAPQI